MKKIFYLFTILSCFVLTACGGDDDEPQVSYQDITLACKKTHTIKGDAVWTSSNKFIASVSGNVVTAERVGEATISSSKGTFKVKVTPTVSVYKEPYLKWGASKSSVKSFMSGATIEQEKSDQLVYKGTGALINTIYHFENSGLKASGLTLDGDYINPETLMEQMLQYYLPVTMDEVNYSFYFATPDKKTAAMLKLNDYDGSICYIILYAPISGSNAEKYRAASFDFKTIESAIGITNTGNHSEKFNEMKNLLF